MTHPFKVDKTYRNRVGEYVVLSIDGDQMTIRYVGGGTLNTNVHIQARIWENIQFEEQTAREEERRRLAKDARLKARRRSARAQRALAQPKFAGFVASDFEAKKRGIAWSSRKELGKFLAFELSKRMKGGFAHWIVPRKSRIHIARTKDYDKEARDKNVAFFVAVDEEGVAFGLCVGKPAGKVRAGWRWPAFLALLGEDSKTRRALRSAMRVHELDLDVYAMDVSYGRVGQISVQARGFLWQHETADGEMTRRMNWKQLVDYLDTIAPGKRSNVYLYKRLSGDEAVKAGADVSSLLSDLFQALEPVYNATVGA